MKPNPPLTEAAKGLPSAKKSKTAAPGGSFTVITRIPGRQLRAFEFYARHYNVPLVHLVSSEAYKQAACIDDFAFAALEWLERLRETSDLEEVRLEYCPDAYAILSRAAELLRRPLDELLGDCLMSATGVIEETIDDCTSGKMEWEHPDKISQANDAVQFARLASWNRSPGSESAKCKDGWELFGLKRPEELEILLALKGGAAS